VQTFRIDLAYDGSDFHGFARQAGIRTVQGELEAALSRIFHEQISTVGAGRTDTGVHARAQVISFTAQRQVDPPRVQRALTSILGPEIVATACSVVDPAFNARFSATWRSYRYRVLNAAVPDPLRHRATWHVAGALDLDRMQRVASQFVGEHDFASFCRRSEGRSTVRRVFDAGWAVEHDLLVFSIRASAFCHQMVRSLTGLCVDAGLGRVDPESVSGVIAARDRAAARQIAPPHGLILWEVGYGGGSEEAEIEQPSPSNDTIT
jgi:tRNA pseudouridine38-40 synthase